MLSADSANRSRPHLALFGETSNYSGSEICKVLSALCPYEFPQLGQTPQAPNEAATGSQGIQYPKYKAQYLS